MAEENDLRKSNQNFNLNLAEKFIKKTPTQSKFEESSVPLHIPHSSLLLKHKLNKTVSTASDFPNKLSINRKLNNKRLNHQFDINELFDNTIKRLKDNAFIYLTYSVPKSSEYFTPYSLMEVPYRCVAKNQYYTVSRHGVTYWSRTENQFTKLEEWQNDYNKYCEIMKIKTFFNFRIWKGFKVWQKTIQWKKIFNVKKYLEENLFIAIPPLANAILLMRYEFCQLIDLDFVDDQNIQNWYLFYFIEAQMAKYERIRDLLKEFRERLKFIIYEACFKAFLDKKFSLDDEILTYSKKQLKEFSVNDRLVKRRYCILLSRFLNLCDYTVMTLLHTILQNTLKKLSLIFVIHDKFAPNIEDLKMGLVNNLEKERPKAKPEKPLIKVELVLKQKSIEVDPSRNVTYDIFMDFIDLILAAVYDIERFQSDEYFNQFTKPSILGRQEKKLCGDPPDLECIFVGDIELQNNKQVIFDTIRKTYAKIEIYKNRFDSIRINYDIDLKTEPNEIKDEKDIEKLRKYCERYVKEIVDLEVIEPKCNLGLLELKQHTFKEKVIPVCRYLISVLEGHLPKLAIECVTTVTEKTDEIKIRLQTPPENTIQFVNYMRYSDMCLTNIEKLDEQLKYAYHIFLLMKDYQIFIDEQQKDNYLDCQDLIKETKNILETKIKQKPELIIKLADCLQIDITKIFEEVDDVHKEVVQDWFLQEESDPTAVKDALQLLLDRLSICFNLSQDYRKYQKEFKIDVTRFDTLDLVIKEVKQRQLLWFITDEWTDAIRDWHYIHFHSLIMDDLINLNMKILKNCIMLEKNLPTNKLIPKLKISAEEFKQKLPIIGYLRNPSLKMRHWLKIEKILNKKLKQEDKISLQTFIDANAFDIQLSEAIMEVSGQASAEAGLEILLKKVENSWKEFDLSIVQHRDIKDVYILAGVEEIQTTLDESNIIINTIAASRHFGPIKSKVDDWIRLLDIFGKTLEEWMACQQSWIYLEAIFSAPDIQRQLPNEARMFLVVDKTWKEILRDAYKMPLALSVMTDPKILPKMTNNNMLLEKITRCLEAYLEVKRVSFPRFYFLSNDELLEILAQTKNPHAVQPHLRKCFDAIAKLEFGSKDMDDGGKPVLTTDIVAMISPEGERVLFEKGLKARGSVEDWLCKVEMAMFNALKRCMKFAYQCYTFKDRSEWFQDHSNQIVLTVSQQQWAFDVHEILNNDIEEMVLENMKQYEIKLKKDLQKLASIARTDISKLLRKILCALITIDVHAMDTITNLLKQKVVNSDDFNWLKMLRYYWVKLTETMEAKMATATLPYFYEYLGAGGVLVITPLTDRCYLCLMGALQMDLGGAPAGPAGTGKTETTKDLAKALAKQCVVFNCSEGLDYKMMGRFFSGLSQSGSWCCFDEFNRIDIEVLSVIAQQLITIRTAKLMRQKRFMFEGREIKLEMSCAAFITMNPGYAGRTELPDNLKALFRPMSMMVPDYGLIAEVILYSEGFEESKLLAQKMVQMYKLCSEQLSQQSHYDFGMRAVKSVLVMAGTLKRAAPDQREDITLIAALRDSNLPKFLVEDAKLFKGILGDLFPGVELPIADYGELQLAVEYSMKEKNLQTVPDLVSKIIQLYDTMCVRWGVMLVGPTGGGKTCVLHTLADALTKLYNDYVAGPNYRYVRIQTLNPKSVSLDELYGAVNATTLEWRDGLLGLAVRAAVVVTEEEHQWVVCDGPVDAVWIENMNTVLDDNKMLCLANSERIKLTNWVHMVFEVQDLSQASPATVSRCGMVYVDPCELGWIPIVISWRQTITNDKLLTEFNEYIFDLFNLYLNDILKFSHRYCTYTIHQVDVSKVTLICNLLQILINEANDLNLIDKKLSRMFLCKILIWCFLWSIGGNFTEDSKQKLEIYIRKLVENNTDIELPDGILWDFRINPKTKQWENWLSIVPNFDFNLDTPYFDMLVPTSDTARFGYVAGLLLKNKKSVLFTGDTGVGKSVLAKSVLSTFSKDEIISVIINFSAQTSTHATQDMLELRLEKRKKTLLGPPMGKQLIVFVDDVNMPKLDLYGSQPPIELLRQFLDFNGVYDREKMFWKEICDVVLGAACAPPGGGRNPLTPRFVRHFALLQLPSPSSQTLSTIFNAIMIGFLDNFNAIIKPLAEPIINASVDIYETISRELLPTPTKSHYVFNLRDLSKCIQGVLQADPSNYNTTIQITRLFYHESMRVFHDRLINNDDKDYFKQLMKEICVKYFQDPINKADEVILFGDFMVFGQSKEDRIYEEIKDLEKLKSVLMEYLEDYNGVIGTEMKLILFQDAIEHITRLARLLRAERGNGLLVGLSGMGKQSLSRLATHLNGYKCFQIELCRGYDSVAFHEDLKKLYWTAGVLNNPTVFLITDTQIVKEEFLEDINNILNSGEVPNLFESDDYERVILGVRDDCLKENKDCTRDDIYNFFINRVRANLHLIICMSPIGDAFRRRCRMFPSLVNCSTIDWFVKWPPEALYSVALGSLKDITENEEQCENLSKICVSIHESIEKASEDFHKEMRRHYYTTPSSYLELLKLYRGLLKKRADLIEAKRARISNGLNKILETNELVVVMGEELQKFMPIIEERSESMKELLLKLDKDTEIADVVRINVTKDETDAKIKAAETQEIADDASKDLETAMPALSAAQEALKGLNKSDVNELRSFQVPPKLVQFVMEPVCLLLGAKPDWPAAKLVMADVNFLKRLVEFDKEHIPEKTLIKLKTYINHKDFDPAIIEKVSKVCKSMCLWVRAMVDYAKIYKIVEPKIRRYKNAEAELKDVMAILKQKQSELAEIEGKIQSLTDMIDEKNQEFKIIQDNFDTTSGRLNRAGRLTSALFDEEIRWKETVKNLTKELWSIPGDVLVSSACVAYLGAFSINYRKVLVNNWVTECKRLKIPSSGEFNLLSVLGDPYLVRCWNMNGLPRDEISVENGIIVTQACRWPLMIDPQEQANRWIRNMEKENELRIIKMTDPNLMRILEICIRQGFPLLLEEIEETIDPTLAPILERRIIVQGGRLLIKLGDSDVDYDENFKLYMTTKLANPHYLPEVCIQVTLVNFLVTLSGLEDQLLADVVSIEMPELEKQRSDLIVIINTDRQQLISLEDKVLKLLFSSEGNILDDEELVETLNGAKETSAIIAARLIDTEKTEAVITITREKYRPLASRGANIFFVVSNLSEIDPMYQNSLKYFSQIFCSVIQAEHEKVTLEERLKILMDAEVYAIYENVSRGLFEKHKLIYSFLLAVVISKELGNVTENEFQFVLRGPIGTVVSNKVKPDYLLSITEYQWKCCCYLEQKYENFTGLCDDLGNSIILIIDDFQLTISFTENPTPSKIKWNEILSPFQKLMLINSLQSEKLVIGITSFVRTTIGKRFTEISKKNTLATLFLDTSSTTPLVFLLSTGSDPMSALIRFAQEMNNIEKLHSISLGQGQGPTAANLIDQGRTFGYWIFLQNCHLATSWMISMENIIRDMTLGVTSTHKDFRLFLSSMPTKSFPVSVLQNSLKITNEPPKGLRANLIRSLDDITKDYFEPHILQNKWRSMVFGICMFHGVLLERRKFGPLGWNITYEFTESDRECGLKILDMFCEREKPKQNIPWASLEYINGEITWGGRVTDYWDQRCLKTILKIFSSERIFEQNYTYSPSGIYYSPNVKTLDEFRTYALSLPLNDVLDIFGMHENANIVFESKETQFFIETLLEGQPRTVENESASLSDDICLDMIEHINKSITTKLLMDDIQPELIKLDSKERVPSLTTVLIQEVERYNNLLDIIHDSLINLHKAIKGFVVMSGNLEAIYFAFLNNQVPNLWASKGFLSTKTLANWVIDFQYRIDYIQTWILNGTPCSSWLSGLYFPQSFLTGVLQTHARRHNLPIDSLKIDFEILNQTISQKNVYQKHMSGAIENSEIYMGLEQPETGIYIHGIFIEAGRWDISEGGLCDSRKGELLAKLPVVWLKPCLELNMNGRYESPLYKTPVRAGVLSTTGHSTNFVLALLLDSRKPSDFWILRGTALLTMGSN